MEVTRDQRAALGEAVMRLERDFYGRGPSSVRVSVSDSAPFVITVLSVDSLTVADKTLTERSHVAAVVSHHQAIHNVTAEDFIAQFEAILGWRPDAYLAQVDPQNGYAVRVFVRTDEG